MQAKTKIESKTGAPTSKAAETKKEAVMASSGTFDESPENAQVIDRKYKGEAVQVFTPDARPGCSRRMRIYLAADKPMGLRRGCLDCRVTVQSVVTGSRYRVGGADCGLGCACAAEILGVQAAQGETTVIFDPRLVLASLTWSHRNNLVGLLLVNGHKISLMLKPSDAEDFHKCAMDAKLLDPRLLLSMMHWSAKDNSLLELRLCNGHTMHLMLNPSDVKQLHEAATAVVSSESVHKCGRTWLTRDD